MASPSGSASLLTSHTNSMLHLGQTSLKLRSQSHWSGCMHQGCRIREVHHTTSHHIELKEDNFNNKISRSLRGSLSTRRAATYKREAVLRQQIGMHPSDWNEADAVSNHLVVHHAAILHDKHRIKSEARDLRNCNTAQSICDADVCPTEREFYLRSCELMDRQRRHSRRESCHLLCCVDADSKWKGTNGSSNGTNRQRALCRCVGVARCRPCACLLSLRAGAAFSNPTQPHRVKCMYFKPARFQLRWSLHLRKQ